MNWMKWKAFFKNWGEGLPSLFFYLKKMKEREKMFIEVTKEEVKLITDFRKRKNEEKIFKNHLENYKKVIAEMKMVISNLDNFLNDDDFYDIFREECDEEIFNSLKDIVDEINS